MASLQTFIDRMVYWCRDVSLGYSQSDRWDIVPGGNCDCSSLVIHCLQEAGFDTGSATYTGNLSAQLTARGWVRLPPTVAKQAGDILLNDVHHVAVMISGTQLAQASISENGTAYGVGGDQTGGETNITNYYDYNPWNCVLRYTGEDEDDMTSAEDVWNFNQNGVKVRDRLQGTDAAANAANNEIHRLSKWDEKTHQSPLGNLVTEQPIKYNGSTAKLGDRIGYIDAHTHVVDTKLEALTAAVNGLSKAMGADPEQIAKIVEDAVKEKLDSLDIKITAE